jgi:hypothetical protein
MIDMSIPIVSATIVAEVIVVASSFLFSDFLNRSDHVSFRFSRLAKNKAHGWEEATPGKWPPKKTSYKDEKESYFDHSATATQMKFERVADHG